MSQLEDDTSESNTDSSPTHLIDSVFPGTGVSSDSSLTGTDSTMFDTVTGTGNSGTDTLSDSTMPDTNSGEADTLFTNREPHFCDNLGWDACMDADDQCGRMYLEAVHFIDPVGVSSSCESESLFYGCTPWMYCYEDIFLALDPDGRCWLMPTGCLPNAPGWIPATNDELCSEPIWTHTCIE